MLVPDMVAEAVSEVMPALRMFEPGAQISTQVP
jgi:hypothetical protein